MKSNRIVLLLIFLGIAYWLYNKDKRTHPLQQLWRSVATVFSPAAPPAGDKNPYKAPEKSSTDTPPSESTASAGVTDAAADAASSVLQEIKRKVLPPAEKNVSALPRNYYPKASFKIEIVEHRPYTLGYSETHEQAAWTFHVLKKQYVHGGATRSGMEFYPDADVSTQSALSTDYTRSGYDRGHLVPAGDFQCCSDFMAETFRVSNVSPQDRDMNRNIWNNLEQQTRRWADKYGEIYVFTGPVLRKGLPAIGRYNRISIPEFFYKIIFIPDSKEIKKSKVKAFLIPNKANLGLNFNDYLVSVDELEDVSGINFLSTLPDDVENVIESRADKNRW